jgi:hypothetical protein
MGTHSRQLKSALRAAARDAPHIAIEGLVTAAPDMALQAALASERPT